MDEADSSRGRGEASRDFAKVTLETSVASLINNMKRIRSHEIQVKLVQLSKRSNFLGISRLMGLSPHVASCHSFEGCT